MDVDFVAISGLVGALLPLVISAFKNLGWSSTVKKSLAMVLSLVAAVIVTGATQGWSQLVWSNLLASASVIIALAQTTYLGFWEDTAVEVKLASLGN